MKSVPEKPLKILIVDDEEQIRRALVSILSARKYESITAENGEKAIDLAIDHSPDLILLDLSLPGISGLEVCKEIRTWCNAPIIVISVRDKDTDIINALDLGADDYITKPFSAGELLARIRALFRRTVSQQINSPIISLGELEINLASRIVKKSGQEVNLTRTEFDILSCLAQNIDCIVTSKMILEKVWGPEFIEDFQTLRVHISNLRKKIEKIPSMPKYIITEPGVGFRLCSN
ncbi:MAG: response regulator transcription factor [Actinobacteria bacterium]|nr:response regulator transcription factor [Actinomycetota bacterium]MCL5985516.1 response regulator transcription factor [Actinomycetota bacterium]